MAKSVELLKIARWRASLSASVAWALSSSWIMLRNRAFSASSFSRVIELRAAL